MFTKSPYQRSIQPVLAEFGIQAPDLVLNELVLDSREVAIHSGFIALKGHAKDGRDFIPQAISLGAKLILAETDDPTNHGQISMRKQSMLIDFYQLPDKLSALAACFYGYPAKQLQAIAVTGTNGKTSTVQLCSQLSALLGRKSASIGTLGAKIYQDKAQQEAQELVNTTPDAISMQRLLRQFCDNQVQDCAFEASSHALVQGRISAIDTKVAIFTNLTRDHLDYHGSMAEYAAAKRLLLNQPGLSHVVLNADDPESTQWMAHKPAQVGAILVSCQGKPSQEDAYCYAEQIRYTDKGCEFSLQSSWGTAQVKSPLIGAFNVSNLLCALAAQLALGADLNQLIEQTAHLTPVAGRMELYASEAQANSIIDYAHTPDALMQALTSAREHCQGQLWCLFGCGGDRDKGKRPLMGEVAEKYADHLVLTNDNSRIEDPQHIVDDILTGIRNPDAVQVELDRTTAIRKALSQAQTQDLILIAGKGHEDYQLIGAEKIHYNERQFVSALYRENTHD